jgi:hypothetical protein
LPPYVASHNGAARTTYGLAHELCSGIGVM